MITNELKWETCLKIPRVFVCENRLRYKCHHAVEFYKRTKIDFNVTVLLVFLKLWWDILTSICLFQPRFLLLRFSERHICFGQTPPDQATKPGVTLQLFRSLFSDGALFLLKISLVRFTCRGLSGSCCSVVGTKWEKTMLQGGGASFRPVHLPCQILQRNWRGRCEMLKRRNAVW